MGIYIYVRAFFFFFNRQSVHLEEIMRSAIATLTRFELDPHTGIVLDLLDHLSVPADDYAHGEPGNRHLSKHTNVRTGHDT